MTDQLPRITQATLAVLRVFLADTDTERFGLEIVRLTGLPSGTIHPILQRLQGQRWLRSRWEPARTALGEGRPRRRYFRLTPDGEEYARLVMR